MSLKLLASLFSIALLFWMPLNVSASASDSARINLSVVVKATEHCEYQFLPLNYSYSNQAQFSNCDMQTAKLQQQADQTAFHLKQQATNDNRVKKLRVVMIAE